MKRRTFIKNSIPLVALPGLVKGIPVNMLGGGYVDGNNPSENNRILVVIELNGGNDGLNTFVPLDQYKNLTAARANILLPESKILPLADTNIVGMHPSLKSLQELYNQKKMSVVQSVGYKNFCYSHFRAADIIQTASGADNALTTGFLGRYLNQKHKQYPKGYPNTESPHPLAIAVGQVPVSTLLQGHNFSMGLNISNNTDFYNLNQGVNGDAPLTYAGKEVSFMRQTSSLTSQYENVIRDAGNRQQNLSTKYPEHKNELAKNLKVIAQLIGGGLQTSVYITTQFEYDHHNAQVDTADTTKGKHAELLRQLSEAVAAFMDDLQLMGVQDKVLCMVYSEFGRRIKSNSSYGTDHGSAQPWFFLGTQLKGGIIGNNPQIGANITVSDNLEMQHDYRSVYSTVLKKWFNTSDDATKDIVGNYNTLDIFK